jgi:type IV pilus assembly protein PilW
MNKYVERKSQFGVTLIEIMVSLAISMFLLIGLLTVFSNSSKVSTDLNTSMQQIENGRFAVQALSDDIALAGFYDRLPTMLTAPGSLPDPCAFSTLSDVRAATALPIQGYNAPTTSPLSCIPAANHVARTDILVVRRADTNTTAAGSLITAEVYLQTNANPSDAANPIIALGSAANFTLTEKNGSTVSAIRKYRTHIYFISPCSVPNGGGTTCTGANDDGGSPIPTLKRLELRVNPATNALAMTQVSLVEGIEQLQFDYAVDTTGDGVPDGNYLVTTASVADWANVVAVRINLLARNLTPTSGYTDATTYDLGVMGGTTPGGAYKRHVYNTVVRLINPAGRKEN